MKKNAYAFLRALVMALAFFVVLNACQMEETVKVADAATPVITAQPLSLSIHPGGDAEFTVTARGGNLSYQWYKYTNSVQYDDQVGELLEDETEPVFTPESTSEKGFYYYYVVVTNTDNGANGRKKVSVKSYPAILAVDDEDNALYPGITLQPVGGETVIYSTRMVIKPLDVAAAVEPADKSEEIRYQWYVTDKPDNTTGIPIEGATGQRLIPPVLLKGQEPSPGKIAEPGNYYYFALVTNYNFNVTGRRESSIASVPALVSVRTNPNAVSPEIKKHPGGVIYFINDTDINELKVEADEPEDFGDLSYQWYSNTRASNSGGTLISGAVNAVYTPAITTAAARNYYYYVVVTNTNDNVAVNKTASVTSRVAEINVTSPSTKTANATFTVQFGGGGANQHQYVRGFGGMDVTWGNFPDYSVQDYENMYNPDILGYNMVRVMILPSNTDINKTMGQLVANQIYTTMDRSRFYENVKTVNRYGGYVLASPWSPPAAWKTNNSINGGGDLRPTDYHNYANYLRAFARNMADNGAPVYAISIQNEPNYTAGYDGCEWTSNQMRNFYSQEGRFLDGVPGYGGGKMLASVKTMNGESANDVSINKAAYDLPAARNNIDIFARHNYGVRQSNGAAVSSAAATSTSHFWIYNTNNPREIWMTEHNLNSNSGLTYPNDHTWNYIWLFMNDVDLSIRINHEAAFIWWSSKRFYSMIGDGTYGARNGEILPRGWGLAHYAKFAKESYRVGVEYSGATKGGTALTEGNNMNGSRYEDFTSTTVKVSAFMKLRGGEVYPANWRGKDVDIAEVEEITFVMFTPTTQTGGSGVDMGTVKLQLPEGFTISSATAMRSNPTIFHRGGTERGTPEWESVPITADRNAAYVELPASTILSVRFTQ